MSPDVIIWVALTVTLAAAVRSVCGFGDALVAMPILVPLLGPRVATPIVALLGLFMGALILRRVWRTLAWRHAKRLVLAAPPGILMGVFGLSKLHPDLLQRGLAIGLLAFVMLSIMMGRTEAKQPIHTRWAWPAGLAAGALGGALNIPGPPVAVYAALSGWSADRARSTMQAALIPLGLMVALGHAGAGLWTAEVWQLVAVGVPAAMLGQWAGARVADRVEPRRFQQALYVLIVVLAIQLLLT